MIIFLLAQHFYPFKFTPTLDVHVFLFNVSQTFSRKERRRPQSADVSCLISGTTDSTLTTATHLWVPKPLSVDPDSKVSPLPNANHTPFLHEVPFIPPFQMA